MNSGGAPRPAPGLQAFSISMANDIPNLGLLSPPLARSSSAESAMPAPIADTPASEADLEAFKASVLAKLTLAIGKDGAAATPRDWFVATALALRDRVIHRWLAVNRLSHAEGRKRVYYLSLEFLIGRLFADVVENLRMTETVEAVAYDTPVVGWRGRHVNPLRLWSARAVDPLRLEVFNEGDHVGALAQQSRAEALSKILYPADYTPAGRELRLRQEYFFVSASLQDILRRKMQYYGDLPSLPDRAAIQLNDTYPSIAISELMRLLMDIHNLPWEVAWRTTVGTFSYTNHTLLPEALETWPVALFERLLPRHLDIIYRINSEHLQQAAQVDGAGDGEHAAVSIIDERQGRHVRMGHLAFVGSHKVNGVSALHTKLMRETVFADLHRLYPDRIVNKTNGITFRRWLHQANPRLTKLLSEVCGREVLDDVSLLPRLAEYADDHGAVWRLAAVKRANKRALARCVHEQMGVTNDPSARL